MNDLIEKIQVDYPEVVFKRGDRFSFRPPKTIFIGPAEKHDTLLLLHELGHYASSHRDFDTDAKRIKMEREAWEKAREFASLYGIAFDEEVVEAEMDSYRNWLDTKSRCPVCGLSCYQSRDGKYHCPRCENFT